MLRSNHSLTFISTSIQIPYNSSFLFFITNRFNNFNINNHNLLQTNLYTQTNSRSLFFVLIRSSNFLIIISSISSTSLIFSIFLIIIINKLTTIMNINDLITIMNINNKEYTILIIK